MNQKDFSHIDSRGSAQMVDVSPKKESERRAVAQATVFLSAYTFNLLLKKALPKGDVLTTAKIAGIQAAKQTSHLIPFCHPLMLSHIEIYFFPQEEEKSLHVQSEVKTTASTGVEMEALLAVQIACLTIYDMCKAVQKDIKISDCRLVHKSGGKSGDHNY